jgi:hypothetical protein
MDVEKTVWEVRKDFETKIVDQIRLRGLYREYNDIPDITNFISRAVEQFPNFNCGVASVYLQHIFGAGAIVQGRYLEHDHTFLLLDRNIIVDITADQYGGPAVYVGLFKEPWALK